MMGHGAWKDLDTSGLASSLSLAAFLLAFAYLSLVQNTTSQGGTSTRPSEHLTRLLSALRVFRLAGVLAIVISALVLLLSQGSPRLWVISAVAIALGAALLVFLVAVDRGSAYLASRLPGVASKLALPLQTPLLRLLNRQSVGYTVPADQGEDHSNGHNGAGPNGFDTTTPVITEEEQANLDTRERSMIRSILRLDESTAREIMVPRVDIIAVGHDTPITDAASRMLECSHSRLPVFRDTIDHIIGVVYSRDLLPFLPKTEEHPHLEEIIRPAFFIPESKRLDDLLRELQEKRVQMAIVVDEYGGIEGLVTLEDLLEEIVGEIEDEFSRSLEPRVVPLANGDIIVDARVTLDYLSELFTTPIESEDVDTVGGLVYSSLGKMPKVGDEVLYDGFRIEVMSILGRRIRKLKLGRTAGTLEA